MWWILVVGGLANPYSQAELAISRIPRAMGPYPSAELCRVAGESLMPRERQFWTAEKIQAANTRAWIRDQEREAVAETSPAEPSDYLGWHIQGTTTGMTSSWFPPKALTGCVKLYEEEQYASPRN